MVTAVAPICRSGLSAVQGVLGVPEEAGARSPLLRALALECTSTADLEVLRAVQCDGRARPGAEVSVAKRVPRGVVVVARRPTWAVLTSASADGSGRQSFCGLWALLRAGGGGQFSGLV